MTCSSSISLWILSPPPTQWACGRRGIRVVVVVELGCSLRHAAESSAQATTWFTAGMVSKSGVIIPACGFPHSLLMILPWLMQAGLPSSSEFSFLSFYIFSFFSPIRFNSFGLLLINFQSYIFCDCLLVISVCIGKKTQKTRK